MFAFSTKWFRRVDCFNWSGPCRDRLFLWWKWPGSDFLIDTAEPQTPNAQLWLQHNFCWHVQICVMLWNSIEHNYPTRYTFTIFYALLSLFSIHNCLTFISTLYSLNLLQLCSHFWCISPNVYAPPPPLPWRVSFRSDELIRLTSSLFRFRKLRHDMAKEIVQRCPFLKGCIKKACGDSPL